MALARRQRALFISQASYELQTTLGIACSHCIGTSSHLLLTNCGEGDKCSQQLQACADPQETAGGCTGSDYDDQSKCEQVCSSSGRSTADEERSWHSVPFCIRNAVLLSVIPEYCASVFHIIDLLNRPCPHNDMHGEFYDLLR